MGISPRSRWSNRDEVSYRDRKTPKGTPWKPQIHKWRAVKGGNSASWLLVGQATGLAALVMLYTGVDATESNLDEVALQWGRGTAALAVTLSFGMTSILLMFRVIISRHTSRKRKRLAKIWILGSIIAAYAIAFT